MQNGGQIVKEGLKKHGVDVERFTYHGKSTAQRHRRGKIRLPGGIPMPCEPTNEQVVQFLKEKILNGEYSMGEEIVPQRFQKLILINKEVKVADVMVTGRKHPLRYIRKQFVKEHEKYMRIYTDEEYDNMNEADVHKELKRINEFENVDGERFCIQLLTLKKFQRNRHLMLWHDTSTISGKINNSTYRLYTLPGPFTHIWIKKSSKSTGFIFCSIDGLYPPQTFLNSLCSHIFTYLLITNYFFTNHQFMSEIGDTLTLLFLYHISFQVIATC